MRRLSAPTSPCSITSQPRAPNSRITAEPAVKDVEPSWLVSGLGLGLLGLGLDQVGLGLQLELRLELGLGLGLGLELELWLGLG